MSYLKLHDAPSDTDTDDTIPETYLFPGVERGAKVRPSIRPSIPDGFDLREIEGRLDHAQDRLNNLRDLVDRFGLSMHDEGPRAA